MSSQPLKWHGGKAYLAAWLHSMFPAHTRRCIPYAGGMAELFALTSGDGVAEFVNDINSDLTNFWDCLKDPFAFGSMQHALTMTPFSEVEWLRAYNQLAFGSLIGRERYTHQKIADAIAFFVKYRMSRQGLGKHFATPTGRLRRNINENVSSYLSAIDGLPDAHARLQTVEIRCGDAIDFILELDSPDTFFYLDPPYLDETRVVKIAYEHEMTVEKHYALLQTLSTIKGKFLLSGYPSSMYDEFAKDLGWQFRDKEIDNKASSKKVKDKKTERVWANYELPAVVVAA